MRAPTCTYSDCPAPHVVSSSHGRHGRESQQYVLPLLSLAGSDYPAPGSLLLSSLRGTRCTHVCAQGMVCRLEGHCLRWEHSSERRKSRVAAANGRACWQLPPGKRDSPGIASALHRHCVKSFTTLWHTIPARKERRSIMVSCIGVGCFRPSLKHPTPSALTERAYNTTLRTLG